MSETSNRALERAQELAESEAAAGVAAASALLMAAGSEVCRDCGRLIPAERRRALPSATRCIDCQDTSEGAR